MDSRMIVAKVTVERIPVIVTFVQLEPVLKSGCNDPVGVLLPPLPALMTVLMTIEPVSLAPELVLIESCCMLMCSPSALMRAHRTSGTQMSTSWNYNTGLQRKPVRRRYERPRHNAPLQRSALLPRCAHMSRILVTFCNAQSCNLQ